MMIPKTWAVADDMLSDRVKVPPSGEPVSAVAQASADAAFGSLATAYRTACASYGHRPSSQTLIAIKPVCIRLYRRDVA
jgi:hypothetical protein